MIQPKLELNNRGTAIIGLCGAAAITLGSLISGLAFTGRTGEPYSPFNHFVSELGEVGVSRLAWAFNTGLIIAGLCFTIFVLGVAARIRGRFRLVFGPVGVVAGMSGALVGVFPMDQLRPHAVVAMTFFYVGLCMTALFSLYVLLSQRREFPRWLFIPGALTFASFFAFLFLTEPVDEASSSLLDAAMRFIYNRPVFSATATLEWAVITGIVGWVVLVALHLLVKPPAQDA